MDSKKTVSGTFVIFLALCVALLSVPVICTADSGDAQAVGAKPQIIRIALDDGSKVSVYGKAFLLEKPGLPYYPPILHVQGTPYEMGYQHGVLLADRIEELISGVGTPMMYLLGGWNPESGQKPAPEQLEAGKAIVKLAIDRCFIGPIQEKAPDYLEEARGLADGLRAAGSPAGLDEVLAGIALAELTQNSDLAMKLAGELVSMQPKPPSTEGPKNCSDFAAWGTATKNGKLIHGTNYDNEDFTVGRRGVVLIAKPEKGNAFLGMIHPGSPWPMRGMSEAGITVGEPTSNSADNDILAHPQAGHCVQMRRVLQYANSTQDAINIMKDLGGSTGWNIFTTDGKVPSAVDIEVSCTMTGVVYPTKGTDALWSTNQFTAYPGFQGYPKDGPNLVKGQVEYWGVPWKKVNTIEKWQTWLRQNRAEIPGGTWARYERLRELLKENRGQITPEKVMAFLSDPVLSSADPKITLSEPVKHLFGNERPIVSQHLASVFSAVFVPADSIAYVAMGAEPAQAGKYWPINLKEQLRLMEAVSALKTTEPDENALRGIFQERKPLATSASTP